MTDSNPKTVEAIARNAAITMGWQANGTACKERLRTRNHSSQFIESQTRTSCDLDSNWIGSFGNRQNLSLQAE